MIQSDIINGLMKVYKQAVACYKYKQCSSFYKCLRNQLVLSANKYQDSEAVLYSYKVACKSYLDSKVLDFNIGIITLLISIVGLGRIIEDAGVISVVGIMVLIVYLGYGTINAHIKKRKVIEIYNVLDAIRMD